MQRFLLGVNYWPRAGATAMWTDFDAAEIDGDFARIAAIGLDVVRFSLDWNAFQSSSDEMSADAFDRFDTVLDLAGTHGLRAMPILFGNPVSSDVRDGEFGDLLEAQRTFARAIGERAREHGALFCWDLGDAFSNAQPHARGSDAPHWSAALTHDLFDASNASVTGGPYGRDLDLDATVRFSAIAEPWRFATMHDSLYGKIARDRADPDVVPFLCELAASCSHKRILFSAIGNPTDLTDHEVADYALRVLDRLQRRGALGAMWRSWGDVPPVAQALAAFARERRMVVAGPQPIVDEHALYAGLPESLERAYRFYCESTDRSEDLS